MKFIYMDNNATTKVSDEVFEAMLPFFRELYGNPSSIHTFGSQVANSINTAREQVAEHVERPPVHPLVAGPRVEQPGVGRGRGAVDGDDGRAHLL